MMMVENHAGSKRILWQLFRKMAALISLSCLPQDTPLPPPLLPFVLEDEVNFQDLRPVLHSLAKNLSVSLWKALPFKQSINYTNTRAPGEKWGCKFRKTMMVELLRNWF